MIILHIWKGDFRKYNHENLVLKFPVPAYPRATLILYTQKLRKIKNDGIRNPLIAEILYKSKEIERWGSGLKRIYEECKAGNVKVEFKDFKTGFLVVFYRSEEGTTPKTTHKISCMKYTNRR